MQFYSKNFHENFDFLNIFNVEYKIKKVYISSAYCDPDTIYTIKNQIKANISSQGCDFKVFMDRNANHALPGQDLYSRWKRLNTRLSNEISERSGIFLVENKGKLFHSKLLYIETTQTKKICIGSMNYTVKGTSLDENEEILLEIDSNRNTNAIINECYQYFITLSDNSINICDLPNTSPKYDSLYDFFSSGSLCFEYPKSNLFTFKLDIPKSLKRNRSRIEGFYDITEDTINIIDTFSSYERSNRERSNWKKFTIETPYGLFTPLEFKTIIDRKIDYKESKSDLLIKNIIASISDKSKADNLIVPYLKRVNCQCNDLLKERGEQTWDLDRLLGRWNKWYDRLMNIINEDEGNEISTLIWRYIHGIDISPVPDIFNDKFTYYDFLNNFIASINYKISLSEYRVNNKFIAFLIEFCERYDYDYDNIDIDTFKSYIINNNFKRELINFAHEVNEID